MRLTKSKMKVRLEDSIIPSGNQDMAVVLPTLSMYTLTMRHVTIQTILLPGPIGSRVV